MRSPFVHPASAQHYSQNPYPMSTLRHSPLFRSHTRTSYYSRDRLTAIRRQRNTIHRIRMPLEHSEAHPVLQIPYPYRVIVTPRDPLSSIQCQRNTMSHAPYALLIPPSKPMFQLTQIGFTQIHPSQIGSYTSHLPEIELLSSPTPLDLHMINQH